VVVTNAEALVPDDLTERLRASGNELKKEL